MMIQSTAIGPEDVVVANRQKVQWTNLTLKISSEMQQPTLEGNYHAGLLLQSL